MKAKANLNNVRVSPRKMRLVADLIKGLGVEEAVVQLEKEVRSSSEDLTKLMNSAIANAENNFGLDKDNLYVESIQVNEAPTLKRWMPRAHGRATTILKRTSRVSLVLAEIVEGKNRKTKEQMEKERKAREAQRKKLEKEITEGKEETKEKVSVAGKKVDKISKDEQTGHFEAEGKRKQTREGGWVNKMFRRKSS